MSRTKVPCHTMFQAWLDIISEFHNIIIQHWHYTLGKKPFWFVDSLITDSTTWGSVIVGALLPAHTIPFSWLRTQPLNPPLSLFSTIMSSSAAAAMRTSDTATDTGIGMRSQAWIKYSQIKIRISNIKTTTKIDFILTILYAQFYLLLKTTLGTIIIFSR